MEAGLSGINQEKHCQNTCKLFWAAPAKTPILRKKIPHVWSMRPWLLYLFDFLKFPRAVIIFNNIFLPVLPGDSKAPGPLPEYFYNGIGWS